jgi:hypothetical protein
MEGRAGQGGKKAHGAGNQKKKKKKTREGYGGAE